jgi:positive regulator of sigma E activity
MAASAALAATNFVASGGKTVSGEVHAERQSTCSTCPSHNATANRCNECGCFLQLKTWLPAEQCPLGKW